MYAQLDVIGLAVAEAAAPGGAVARDRQKYFPYLAASEEFAAQRGLIIGGKIATLLLLGEPLGPSDYYYEMYSANALKDARELTELLYNIDPSGMSRYTFMTTRVPRKEFEISVNERPLIVIRALPVHRGARVADLVIPSLRPAYFAEDDVRLRCLGPELQLIGMYAALADPAFADQWASLLQNERGMRELFVEEIGAKIAKATGGAVGSPRLHSALFRDYVPLTGHALVGPAALAYLRGAPPQSGRIQIVSANTFADEEKALRAVANRLKVNLRFAQNDPQIPTDTDLRRLTVSIVHNDGTHEAFLNVYSTPQLVGYTTVQDIPCGSVFTIMRFLLVEAWAIQLIMRIGAVSPQYAQQVLGRLVADFDEATRLYNLAVKNRKYDWIFPGEYVGRFRDPVVHAKRARRQAQLQPKTHYYPPYYPAISAEKGETP